MWWRRLIAWAAVAVVIAFVAADTVLLNVRIRDFDEGVYWQSIRALARGEPLFSSVFASQPPGFYYALLPLYALAHSLASLRLTVLLFGSIGLIATYAAGRLLAGPLAGLIALVLAAASPLYFHESAILQADGPSVALSMLAVALALLAVRADGRRGRLVAAAAGLALAAAIGIKFLGAVTVIPIGTVLLGDRRRRELVGWAFMGLLVGSIIVFLPALFSPGTAFSDLVLTHTRAGQFFQQGLLDNVELILLHRDIPLELLALAGTLFGLLRKDRAIVMPLVWVGASIAVVLLYHPLFAHHVVMLSLPLALTAAIGLTPHTDPPNASNARIARSARLAWAGGPAQGGREILSPRGGRVFASVVLVFATGAAGVLVDARDVQLAMVPDLHDNEMTGAVRDLSRPGDFWISDNPFAVAAADRDIPGPLVDTSTERTHAGLLTIDDLEAARARYHVRWLLEDSFRLDVVPEYRRWLNAHFHAVENLGGRAVVYEAD